MTTQFRLIELPRSAFKADAGSDQSPLQHLRAYLAVGGVFVDDLAAVEVGFPDYALIRSSVTAWMKDRGLRPDLDALVLPRPNKRVPKSYVLVPQAAVTGGAA